jgi:geranylgeranyl reductase family protein
MELWDTLVIGAGPAGCAAAYDLARAGRSVLLLDKSAFPRPKACAAGLTAKTLRALRYSVEPVTRGLWHDVLLERPAGKPVRISMRKPVCAMAVRQEFDAYCLEQTLAADARFRRIGPLTAIRQGPDGLTLEAGGEHFRSRFLIGADGANSQVRSLTGPHDWFYRGFALEAHAPMPANGADLTFDFAALPGGYGWIFPKRDHLNIGIGVFAGGPEARFGRADLLRYAQARLGHVPLTSIVGQYLGLGGWNYRAAGRVLLAGDAAGLVDPLTGEGIYSAVASGQAAAAAILADLRGQGPAAAHHLALTANLRQQLAFSARAARSFYANIDRGFRAMTIPVVRGVIMRAYAYGIGSSRVLSSVISAAMS